MAQQFPPCGTPSLHRVARDHFPGFFGTMGCSETLRPIPPSSAHHLARGYHQRKLRDGGERRGSQVPGQPSRSFAMLEDPGRTLLRMAVAQPGAAPASPNTKAPTFQTFRGSFTQLQSSLPTLRDPGCPRSVTQDSLLAGGQPLPDGIRTRRVALRSFNDRLHHFLSSQALPGATGSVSGGSGTASARSLAWAESTPWEATARRRHATWLPGTSEKAPPALPESTAPAERNRSRRRTVETRPCARLRNLGNQASHRAE